MTYYKYCVKKLKTLEKAQRTREINYKTRNRQEFEKHKRLTDK